MQTPLPLARQSLLITRALEDQAHTATVIRQWGGEAIACPVIRMARTSSPEALNHALQHLETYAWLVLTSAHAVEFFVQWIYDTSIPIDALPPVAVIGAKTEQACIQRGINPSFVSDQANAEAFAEAFPQAHTTAKKRILYPRSAIAQPTLVERLRASGATVDDPVLYETHPVDSFPDEVIEGMKTEQIDWVLFFSGSAVRNFHAVCESSGCDPSAVRSASIGPSTTAALHERGLTPDAEAEPHTLEGILDAIARASQ